MVFSVEDPPCLLLKAVFDLSGWIGQGPDFEELKDLSSKCYLPALLWYHANVWVRMCFGRFAMTLQCIY